MSLKNKIKRQKREKEAQVNRKKFLGLQKYWKEYYENKPEYPTSVKGEKKKRINFFKEFRKLLKKQK